MPEDFDTARNVLKSAAQDLLERDNVVATGVGYKVSGGTVSTTPAIVCSVTRKLPESQLSPADLVPATFDGVVTDVVQSGRIRALQARTDRQRPAPGGVSIGHFGITAGTLGCLVKRGNEVFILSNNHVLANSNDAESGDAILQPGPVDGGNNPGDKIAELEDFVPISFPQPEPPSDCAFANAVIAVLNAGCAIIGSATRYRIVRPQADPNLVDAAIGRPSNPAEVSSEIVEIGELNGAAEATLGTAVQKSGRTTGYTTGVIQQIDVTVDVEYGPGATARFTDQLLAGAMSQGGDSGSAVLDMDRRLVGLLFAGSESTTIINRIQHVFSELNISL